MRATHPNQITDLMLVALNDGDVEAVVALYEDSAIIVDDLLNPKRGREGVRKQITDFLSLEPTFDIHETDVAQTDNLALVQSRWRVAWTDDNGKSASNEVSVSIVARKQDNGHWLINIDRPIEISRD